MNWVASLVSIQYIHIKTICFLKLYLYIFFILTMGQITRCDVKGVAVSDKTTENDHQAFHFPFVDTEHFNVF